MKPSLRTLLVFLGLAALLAAAFLRPGLFVAALIDPLARIAWLVIRTLLVIDPTVYWTLLTFAAFVFLLRILPTRPQSSARPAYHPPVKNEDRVAYWQALLESAAERAEGRSALEQELETLRQTIQALAGDDGSETVNLPLLTSAPPSRPALPWQRFWPLPLSKSRQLLASARKGRDLHTRVALILEQLETKLERNQNGNSPYNDSM